MEKNKKVILLGIDGGTFDLFLPWIEKGLLPHMKKIMREGTWGHLASTIPPTTPPAWSSCITGNNPGKHGIFDFRESPLLHPDRPLISSASIKGTKLWHILNHYGKKVAIFNVPITYPPEKVDGCMISGLMTPGKDSPCFYPEELKDRLLSAIGDYVPNIDIPGYDVEAVEDALAFLAEVFYIFEKRRDAFFYLMESEPWDFFMPVFILHDRIQHLFWKYIDESFPQYHTDKGKIIREKIIECYQAFDTMLGELEKRIEHKDIDLFIISDHGFGSTLQWFNVNKWLEDLGLLKIKPVDNIKKKLFFRAMLLSDSPLVRALIPSAVQRAIRKKVRQTRSTFKSDIDKAIDWNTTRAFFASIPCQGIFINVKRANGIGVVSPGQEYDDLRKFIKDKLLFLDDPITGKKLIDTVWYREEIYSGPVTRTAPDIIFVAQNYSTLGRQLLGAPNWLLSSQNAPNGFHRSNGVFIAKGNHIKTDSTITGSAITDIAPTVLYSFGLPIPSDMDGRYLQEIYREDHVKNNPVQYREPFDTAPGADRDVYSQEDIAKVQERLKGLGYLE